MINLIKDKNWNFPDMKTGDTFAIGGTEIQFQVKKSDLSAPDATLSSVRIMFRQGSETGPLEKSLVSGTDITISDATNWIFSIDKFNIDWDPDTYYYDIETTDSNSIIDTVMGGIIEIKQDVTYT